MELKEIKSQSTVRNYIQQCSEKDHVQQVAYSTWHDALTQVCFGCEKVRTNLDQGE